MICDNSAASQRSRLLNHLRSIGPVTTLQCRHQLDIMHPAARCQELRQAGHAIDTLWVNDVTPEGHSHLVAKYVLMAGKQLNLFDRQESWGGDQ